MTQLITSLRLFELTFQLGYAEIFLTEKGSWHRLIVMISMFSVDLVDYSIFSFSPQMLELFLEAQNAFH